MREHLPDPERFSLEDNEEHGDTQLYFFLRFRDSATVVYKVAVKDGKVSSVLKEVYHGETCQEEPDSQRSRRNSSMLSWGSSSLDVNPSVSKYELR
jgi:hypothetical protein